MGIFKVLISADPGTDSQSVLMEVQNFQILASSFGCSFKKQKNNEQIGGKQRRLVLPAVVQLGGGLCSRSSVHQHEERRE